MIPAIRLKNLRNPEHLQFMTDGNKLFPAYNLDPKELASLYNEKIKEKNKADAYRDKLRRAFEQTAGGQSGIYENRMSPKGE